MDCDACPPSSASADNLINDDLEHLENAIMHTDVDDNPIPITFDLTLILLVQYITNTYSHTIQDWIEKPSIRIVDSLLLDWSAFAYGGQAVEWIYGAAKIL